MNTNISKEYPVRVLCVGILSLILFSVVLFAARKTAQIIYYENIGRDRFEAYAAIPPVLSKKGQKLSHEYSAHARMKSGALYESLGAVRTISYFERLRVPSTANLWRKYTRSTVTPRRLPRLKEGAYFDERLGQFVHYEIGPQEKHWVKAIIAYAGPDGFSKTPDESLGRFSGRFIKEDPSRPAQTVIFDQKLRRFFQLDFVKQSVVKGDELAPDSQYNPVQIDRIQKMSGAINFNLSVKKPKTPRQEKTPPDITGFSHWGNSILILDETGRIDRLDRKTLKFVGTAGYLHPRFRIKEPAKNLLAYKVIPLFTDDKYNGMVKTGIGRDSLIPNIFFLDKDGRAGKNRYHGRMDDFEHVFGPLYLVSRYLLENLHPPILSTAAFYTADSFEAISAQQSLFVNTNSLVGMLGRDRLSGRGGARILRFIAALSFISPSILLSIILSFRVARDAASVGLSIPARRYWRIGVICLGLPAYITYRLTRPKVKMVTCRNCGDLRRPDYELCHRCKSQWHVPELVPPRWRVLDESAKS